MTTEDRLLYASVYVLRIRTPQYSNFKVFWYLTDLADFIEPFGSSSDLNISVTIEDKLSYYGIEIQEIARDIE